MTITAVPIYGGTVPDRKTQTPSQFVDNAIAWTSYQAANLGPGINTTVVDIDAVAVQIDADKVAAATSALSALNSEAAAAASANFKGDWSAQTGTANKPYSVKNDGAIWALVNNLADVTTSEPTVGNADWAFLSGTRWLNVTASAALPNNSMIAVVATGAEVDVSLPAFALDDFFIVQNSRNSTQTVRITNASYTIIGNTTLTAGDNIVLPRGGVVHLRANSTTELEIVSNG